MLSKIAPDGLTILIWRYGPIEAVAVPQGRCKPAITTASKAARVRPFDNCHGQRSRSTLFRALRFSLRNSSTFLLQLRFLLGTSSALMPAVDMNVSHARGEIKVSCKHSRLSALLRYFNAVAAIFLSSLPAHAQDAPLVRTIVSPSRNRLRVRRTLGEFQLFVLGADVRKPDTFPIGTRVLFAPRERSPRPSCSRQHGFSNSRGRHTVSRHPYGVPSIRRLETDIEREARYQPGECVGVALDPELEIIGVQG